MRCELRTGSLAAFLCSNRGVEMRRREFIALISVIAGCPLKAHAQQPEQMRRIGYVAPAAGPNYTDEEFVASLQQHGWVRDRNIKIEYRHAAGRGDTIAPIVAEIAGLGLDLHVVWSPVIAVPLIKAAPQTATVFIITDSDPIEVGLVSNIAHPGGNITGISPPDGQVVAKRLELLKEAVPTLTHVAVLVSAKVPTTTERDVLAKAAQAFSIKLDEVEVEAPSALEKALNTVKDRGAQGLYVFLSGFTFSFAKQISEAANANRLPSIYFTKEGALTGSLLSYSLDLKEAARRGAAYADKILRGVSPGSLAVDQMSKYELVINLKTAKALGISIPPTLLARADEVLE
jgi:putative ABC transport system substrate-binding protein